MYEKKPLDILIDQQLINEIKEGSKSTKYVKKYSSEFRIVVYLLRNNHDMSYREIIDYCELKYNRSPSLGHIKKLIDDGEIEFNYYVENNKKSEFIIQSSDAGKERNTKRKSELMSKMKNNDVNTLPLNEQRELWDLNTIGPTVANYLIQMISYDDRDKELLVSFYRECAEFNNT